jgi:hypothetical protein
MKSAPWLTLGLLLGLLVSLWAMAARRVSRESPSIQGQVVNETDPVSGARLRIKGGAFFALSNRLGRFRLRECPGPGVQITAAMPGYFINNAQADKRWISLQLKRLPAEDCDAYQWIDPGPDSAHPQNCANCHAEIYREWAADGHARAVTNRHFLNLYDGSASDGRTHVGWDLLAQHPDGAGVCNACHAPTATFELDLRRAAGVTARGIHCDFCHKVADVALENLGLTHGRFALKLLRPSEGQLFFGPLDDVDRNEDSFSPLYRESRYCASCHEGVVFGVHVYSTYTEWLASTARREGKQCQSCHMRPTGTFTNIAPGKGGVERDPATLASHRFPGAQVDMLRRCLRVAATVVKLPDGVSIEMTVQANSVGHRVPTGFVDRNLLLVVEAFDHAGRPLPLRSGPQLPPLAGPISGLPGRLYAKQLRDFSGSSPAAFWQADPDFVDTRLFPDQPDCSVFQFSREAELVRIRLVYRRFWHEVAQAKGWLDNEITLVDQALTLTPDRLINWSSKNNSCAVEYFPFFRLIR